MGKIAEKTEFEELTEKQQNVVRAISDNEDLDPQEDRRELAEEADASPSYVQSVAEKYSDIVERYVQERTAADDSPESGNAQADDSEEDVGPETPQPGQAQAAAEEFLDIADAPDDTEVSAEGPKHTQPMSKTESTQDESTQTEPESEPETETDPKTEPETQSQFENERVDVPGRASVHDKRTKPEDREIDHYECPYCEFSDVSERVVRTHITREDDSEHKNRNAFLDQLYVHAVDADGNPVEDVESPKTTTYNGTENTSLIPEGVDPDSKAAEILREAVKHPTKGASDIGEAVYGEEGHNAYVYATISKYLTPELAEDREDSGATDRKAWSDLTDKQRSVIRAYLEDPDRNQTELQEAANVSTGYPRTVLEKYQYVADHIQVRLQTGALSMDDLGDEATLPINFDNPAPGEGAATEGAEGAGAGSGGAEAPTPTATAPDAVAGATAPGAVSVPRDTLSAFATRMETLKESAEVDANIAPEGSEMSIAARKQLHTVETVEKFLRQVAAESDYQHGDGAQGTGEK